MKARFGDRRWNRLCSLLLALLCLPGCAILNKLSLLQRDLRSFDTVKTVTGKVEHDLPDRSRIVVAIFQSEYGSPDFVSAGRLSHEDLYMFLVQPANDYLVVAFDDRDNDTAYSHDEPVGMCAEKLAGNGSSRHLRCDFKLGAGADLPRTIADTLSRPRTVNNEQAPMISGEIADLTDAKFSRAYGEKGLWTPFEFIAEVGVGIYFLEPYDPEKIPVLFVNGAGGYPAQWKYFFDNIDRRKYQPWFFFYPSGVRLSTAGEVLDAFVKSLHERYRFNTLYVTAHSMGGMVARDFIVRNTRSHGDYVKLLVTLSTPWGGHEAAELGLKYSPVAIPSWTDMQTDSDFQKQLFAKPLDARVRYYLFFGHKGRPAYVTGNNDGTVSIPSMLRVEAQNDAVRTYGFDEDHNSILQSPSVLETYNRVLASADAPNPAQPRTSTPAVPR